MQEKMKIYCIYKTYCFWNATTYKIFYLVIWLFYKMKQTVGQIFFELNSAKNNDHYNGKKKLFTLININRYWLILLYRHHYDVHYEYVVDSKVYGLRFIVK